MKNFICDLPKFVHGCCHLCVGAALARLLPPVTLKPQPKNLTLLHPVPLPLPAREVAALPPPPQQSPTEGILPPLPPPPSPSTFVLNNTITNINILWFVLSDLCKAVLSKHYLHLCSMQPVCFLHEAFCCSIINIFLKSRTYYINIKLKKLCSKYSC